MSRLLLLGGADPNARTSYQGNAPLLCLAASEGHTDVVVQLLEFGADVELTGDDGVPALAYAARRCQIDVIRILINRGARVSPRFELNYLSWVLPESEKDLILFVMPAILCHVAGHRSIRRTWLAVVLLSTLLSVVSWMRSVSYCSGTGLCGVTSDLHVTKPSSRP